MGLSLNLKKCAVFSPAPIPADLFPPDIPVDHRGLSILGSPVGPTPFITQFVQDKVEACATLWGALEDLEDPQAETLLLRLCLSFCKVSYLMRTTPLSSFHWDSYDNGIRTSLNRILGATLPDKAW